MFKSINNQLFEKCRERLDRIFNQNKVDGTHGIQHALIVVRHAEKAIDSCKQIEQGQAFEIMLACLLHDADDKKYFPLNKNYDNARLILTEQKLDFQRIQKIVGMISAVSFSKNGDNIDSQKGQFWYYPRYCDRIDAIGTKGLIRAYQYAKVVKNQMYLEQTPVPTNEQELAEICKGRDLQYIKKGGKSISFIDHIYDKLYHLKLPKLIKNPYINEQYEQGKKQIIQYTLRNSLNGFQDAEKQIMDYIQKQKITQKNKQNYEKK